MNGHPTTILVLLLIVAVRLLVPVNAEAQTPSSTLKQEALRHMQAGRYGEAIKVLNSYVSQEPNEADGFRLRGICYEQRSQLERAAPDFRRALQLDPANRKLAGELSRVEKALRIIIEKKIEGYNRELARNPSSIHNYLDIGDSFVEIGKWKEAEGLYDEYINRTDLTPEELLRYCEILAHNNQLTKGQDILQRYTARYAGNQDIWSRYGYFLLWQGKSTLAMNAFEKALALDPGIQDAQEGLQLSKDAIAKATAGGPTSKTMRKQKTEADRYAELLATLPKDNEKRFHLVDALTNIERFGEAFRQLDTLMMSGADSVRVEYARSNVLAVRDSSYRGRVQKHLDRLSADSADKDAALRLASLYSELGDYGKATTYLEIVLADIPENELSDIRFQYAQYAAWAGEYDTAVTALTPLLRQEPDNLDYQLLRGQIAVWSVNDLPTGQRMLANVYRHNPRNVTAILGLASAHALQNHVQDAKEFLGRAQALDPGNRGLRSVQKLYEDAVAAEKDRGRFTLLTDARELTTKGECQKALAKYEEYLATTVDPPTSVVMEYADANSCAKNLDKAIAIYDTLLERGYDFNVGVLRAKNLLWKGHIEEAHKEFLRLTAERPNDFTARLFLGDSYQSMKNYEEARKLYAALLDSAADPEERRLVNQSMSYLPPTGIIEELGLFPTHIAVAPPFTYYSDNQQFQINTYGGRFELGLIPAVSLGASFLRRNLRSPAARRNLTGLKGQLFVRLSDLVSAEGGVGTLTSQEKPIRTIYDATVLATQKGIFSVSAYVEHTDAALVLYSPYLIDLLYTARLYKFAGWYQNKSSWQVSGYFKRISISDENNGNELQFRFGKKFFDQTAFGYEYMFTNYDHPSPIIPFTNHAKQLYYAPQNLESHGGWVDWTIEDEEVLSIQLGGKVAYLPSYKATAREIYGTVHMKPLPYVVLSGDVTFGSTIRFDASYTYLSFAFAAYIKFF